MTTDLPADARDSLLRLLGRAREHARRGEADEVDDLVDRIEATAQANLDDGPLRERLLHGCSEAATANGDEPLVAAEFFRAMEDLVAGADSDAGSTPGNGADGS